MNSLLNKTALITGAASGIGQALAISLAQEGCRVLITDINMEGLNLTMEAIKNINGQASSYQLDIANHEAIYSFSKKVIKDHEHIDILINNAGVELFGEIEHIDPRDIEWLMGINLTGLIHSTRAFIPHLKTRPEANIVNVSSVFGLASVAYQSVYCASKFAVRGFTESLIQELKDTPINLSAVYPSGIKTGIFHNAQSADAYNLSSEDLGEAFANLAATSAESAARTIIRGIKKGKKRIMVGQGSGTLDLLSRYFPNAYHRFVHRQIVQPFNKKIKVFSS